jgi:hypothetical protein
VREASICAGPPAPEPIQTLSAEKTFAAPIFLSPSPITGCDEPYIGEESIMRPPAAKNARITSAHDARAAGSLPTLKVIQLPSPTSGRASPLDGIGRFNTAGAAAEGPASAALAIDPRNVRRVRETDMRRAPDAAV